MHRLTRSGLVVLLTFVLAAVIVVVSSATGNGPMNRQEPRADDATSTRAPPAGADEDRASEVSQATEAPPTSQRLDPPGKAAKRPRLAQPLPGTASSTGKLAAGFPAELIQPVTGSSIRSSGVSSMGSRMQVSLVATNSGSPDTVLGFYRTSLGNAGFVESQAPAVGGSTATVFSHAGDKLVITVSRARSKLTDYSVFGTLQSAASS